MCSENIEWAKNENRTFLRQALEVMYKHLKQKSQLYLKNLRNFVVVQFLKVPNQIFNLNDTITKV